MSATPITYPEPTRAELKFLVLSGIPRQPLRHVRARLRQLQITSSDVVDLSFLPNERLQAIVKRRAWRYIVRCLEQVDGLHVECLAPSDPKQLTTEEWSSFPTAELPALAAQHFADRAETIATRIKDAHLSELIRIRARNSRAHAARLSASEPSTNVNPPAAAPPVPTTPEEANLSPNPTPETATPTNNGQGHADPDPSTMRPAPEPQTVSVTAEEDEPAPKRARQRSPLRQDLEKDDNNHTHNNDTDLDAMVVESDTNSIVDEHSLVHRSQ